MHDSGAPQPEEILFELEAMQVAIDYDVMRIGPRTWGIHGHIAYDGDILAAVFRSEREAWQAISPLRPGMNSRSDAHVPWNR